MFEVCDLRFSDGMLCSTFIELTLTSGDINDGKNDNPNCIDKVPVPGNHLETLAMHDGHEPAQTKDEYQ